MDRLPAGAEGLWADACRRLSSSNATAARAAYEQVFVSVRADLVRYVHHIVRDAQVSHDLVQDTFVDLWDVRETLDATKPLRPFLFGMARNRALRHARDRRRHAEKEAAMREQQMTNDVAASLEGAVDEEALRRRLMVWLGSLPARQREALVLSRFHHLTHAQIAAVMDISPRTVNNHIMRALAYLEARLRTYETAR